VAGSRWFRATVRPYEILDPTEVCRESEHLPPDDIKHRRASTVRCLELHADDSTGGIQKLHTNYEPQRGLSAEQWLQTYGEIPCCPDLVFLKYRCPNHHPEGNFLSKIPSQGFH